MSTFEHTETRKKKSTKKKTETNKQTKKTVHQPQKKEALTHAKKL